MPTKKKRLNLTLPKNVALYLQKIAIRDEVSQSQKAVELIKEALEIEEDEYFSALAEKRDRPGAKFVSFEDVLKKFK